jgi:2,3-bisphosphoglycerate-dependent phosphoglycerate mutase
VPALYLVRHGQTVDNARAHFQGWSDSPLTPDGLEAVRDLAKALADTPFAAAYTSPSPRAATTAAEIVQHHPGLALEEDPGLREMHFGDHEVRPEADVFGTVDPWTMFGAVADGTFPGFPGTAEDGTAFLARVTAAFARIEALHDDDRPVLVVSHGITLLTYLVGIIGAAVVPLENATVSVVDVAPHGRRRLRDIGLTADQVPGLALPPLG